MNANDAGLARCADAIRDYRENPRAGGYEAIRAMVKTEAKRLRMSPGMLFSEAHRLAFEPASSRTH